MRYGWYIVGLFLWLGISATAVGQRDARVVYPVKQNHLWGFITKMGDRLVVPPRYDAIGEKIKFALENDPSIDNDERTYRLVELNGKLGVIDQYLREILPCANEFIRPISPSQFLVKRAEGYAVLDSTGQNLAERYYEQLEFAGATQDGAYYYRIFANGRQGLINAQGDTLLACRYTAIRQLGWQTAPFLVQTSRGQDGWQLVRRGGRVLLNTLMDAKAPHPSVLLVTKEDPAFERYVAYDLQGRPIRALNRMQIRSGTYLTPQLAKLNYYIPADKTYSNALLQVPERRLLHPSFIDFRYLDGAYAIGIAERTLVGATGRFKLETLLTPPGVMVDSNAWYVRINVWEGATTAYKARSRYGWGIINRRGREIAPTEYNSIDPLMERLAFVQRLDSVGVMAEDGQVIVPASYTTIRRRDLQLTLEKADNTTILYLNDSLRVVDLKEYRRLRTLSVHNPNQYRIADVADFKSLRKRAEASRTTDDANNQSRDVPDPVRINPWFVRDTNHVKKTTRLVPLPSAEAVGITKEFLAAHDEPVLGPEYIMRFYEKRSVKLSAYLQQLVYSEEISVKPQRLFAERQSHLADQSVIGCRIFDFLDTSWQVAPALGINGRFHLLGRDLEPVPSATDTISQFTFVGHINNGLLRVCVGGQLANTDPLEVPREPLPSLNRLLADFALRTSGGTLRKSNSSLVVRSTPRDSARWGVIDTLGRWVVPPIYDYLEENVSGQMVARRGNYYGVVDAENAVIVPFEYLKIQSYYGFWRVNTSKIGEVYFNWRGHQILDVGIDSVSLFQENYAAYLQNDRWGYLDKSGRRTADTTTYLQAKRFGEGLAAVQLDSVSWGFIDTTGRVVGQLPLTDYQDLGHFAEGRCWFRRGAKFGFLNREFQEIIPARFRRVTDFVRGRARVWLGAGIAVIDSMGEFIIAPGRFRDLTAWNEDGLAIATSSTTGKKHLVDSSGQLLHLNGYDDLVLAGGPLFPARLEDNWGYVNAQGELIIRAAFTAAQPFCNERARVQTYSGGHGWHFIDLTGRRINKMTYDWTQNFTNGIARVRNVNETSRVLLPNGRERYFPDCDVAFVDGSFIGCVQQGKNAYYLDHQGNRSFLQTYDEIASFQDGEMAFVKKAGRWGIIDRRGMQLVACKYYFFQDRPDGIFKVGPPVFGIYNREGKQVVPVQFDNLVLMEKGLFRVERGEQVGYRKVSGEEVWPLGN
ncbi:MAG: WG repeat-containing protein [Bacteroidota bacterium]